MAAAGPARWGWHQLDARWAERLTAEAGIEPDELVVDVGAGLGAVTGPLLLAGARVVAVELHRGRAAALRRRFAGARLCVVCADGADLRLPREPFRVVASPPFAITSALLRRLLSPGSRLVRADLVLQRAAARRWASGDAPGGGRLGVTFDASLGRPVPRRAFHPVPRVDAAILVVERHQRGAPGRTATW